MGSNILHNELALMKQRMIRTVYPLLNRGVKKVIVNPDDPTIKPVLIIDFHVTGASIFSALGFVMNWIAYADKKGWTPVMRTHTNTDVTWETLWKQPGSVSLENAEAMNHYETTEEFIISQNPGVLRSKSEIRYWQKLFRKYIVLSDYAEAYVKEHSAFIKDYSDVIGVMCRGTDYTDQRPKNHPVQPEMPQVFEVVDRMKEKYKVNHVFLATEDYRIVDQFKEKYGDDLLLIDDEYIDYDPNKMKWTYDYQLTFTQTKIMNYFTNMYIISRCPYYVSGIASGVLGALYMGDGFKDLHLFDLGKY